MYVLNTWSTYGGGRGVPGFGAPTVPASARHSNLLQQQQAFSPKLLPHLHYDLSATAAPDAAGSPPRPIHPLSGSLARHASHAGGQAQATLQPQQHPPPNPVCPWSASSDALPIGLPGAHPSSPRARRRSSEVMAQGPPPGQHPSARGARRRSQESVPQQQGAAMLGDGGRWVACQPHAGAPLGTGLDGDGVEGEEGVAVAGAGAGAGAGGAQFSEAAGGGRTPRLPQQHPPGASPSSPLSPNYASASSPGGQLLPGIHGHKPDPNKDPDPDPDPGVAHTLLPDIHSHRHGHGHPPSEAS